MWLQILQFYIVAWLKSLRLSEVLKRPGSLIGLSILLVSLILLGGCVSSSGVKLPPVPKLSSMYPNPIGDGSVCMKPEDSQTLYAWLFHLEMLNGVWKE